MHTYRQLLRVLAGKRLQKSRHVVTFWWLSNVFSRKFSHFFYEKLTPPNTTSMLSQNPALWASLPIISTHRHSRWIPCWRYRFRHFPLSSTQVDYFQAKTSQTSQCIHDSLVREYIQYMGSCRKITTGPVDVLFWLALKSFRILPTSFPGFLGNAPKIIQKKCFTKPI